MVGVNFDEDTKPLNKSKCMKTDGNKLKQKKSNRNGWKQVETNGNE